MSCRPFDCLVHGAVETVFPICLSPPRLMPSMSRILPYGSRGDVKSDDSHPAYLYPCACLWLMYTYLSMMNVGILPYAITPCHALHRLFVVTVGVVIAAR